MVNRGRPIKFDLPLALSLYQQGEDVVEIARRCGCGVGYTRLCLRKAGCDVAVKRKPREPSPPDDRDLVVVGLREGKGWPFGRIGEVLGMSRQRAQQIYQRAKRRAEHVVAE